MMSIETIRQMSQEAAERAAAEHLEPYIIWQDDIDNMPPFPFPSLGDYVPDGWELVETYFVDSSGFGREDEPALTVGQFLQVLKEGYGYAVIEAGQFQVYVGEFRQLEG